MIKELIGKKVVVFCSDGTRDVGILEGADEGWLKLHKADDDILYFCIHHVRSVKPF